VGSRDARAVWIYGPPGVGKSTAGWTLFEQLAATGPTAYVDIDQLGMCYPVRPSDPHRHQLMACNAGQVLRNLHTAGAQVSVVSGVLYPEAFDVYTSQLRGVDVAFCRLTVGLDELRRRNLARGGRGSSGIADAVREAVDLEGSTLGHPVIDTSGVAAEDVTRRVAALVRPPAPGLDAPSPGGDRPDVAIAPGRVVLVCGPPAVGKSTVAWELFVRLRAAGHVTGFVDLAQIGFLRGGRSGDPDRMRLRSANLAALWRTFATAGASHLVINGSVESEAETRAYAAVFPEADATICRLSSDGASLRERVYERRLGLGPPLAGDDLKNQSDDVLDAAAASAARTDEMLSRSGLGEVHVDTTGLLVDQVATVIAAETHLEI
jgi:adenylylsulfate kinase-like enzyme